jgi:hypothetical protein
MSFLSQLLHGQKSPSQFLADSIAWLKGKSPVQLTDAAADAGAAKIEAFKAAVEAEADKLLVEHFGATIGGLASTVANTAADTLAAGLEGALHTLAGDQPAG